MDFATKMAAMCVIRGVDHNYLCDKLKLDNAVMAMLRKGDILPGENLENRIRRELGWPRESDDLLEELQQATCLKDESSTDTLGAPLKVEDKPSSITPPTTIKPPNTFKKRMSMSYLQRPGIANDSETGGLGTLHGTVVA
jgi:hypothetical protein